MSEGWCPCSGSSGNAEGWEGHLRRWDATDDIAEAFELWGEAIAC